MTSPPRLADIQDWPATVSMLDACRALAISKSHGYALAARDAFPARVLRVGGSYRVVTASLVELLSGAA